MSMRRPEEQTGRQLHDMAWTTDTGIYTVELDKNGPVSAPVLVSGPKRTYNRLPVYSPCSKYIAYLSMDREGYESDRLNIRIHDIGRNKSIQVTHIDGTDIDLCFQGVQWDPSGVALFATVYHKGVTRVFRIEVDIKFEEHFVHATSISMIVGHKSKGDYKIVRSSGGKNDFFYYLESSLSNPPELKRVTLRSEAGLNQKLFTPFTYDTPTDIGEANLPSSDEEQRLLQAISIFCPAPEFENGDIAIPNVTQHYFKGADGDIVHAWYLSPTTISKDQPDASVPLALLIHGGPQSAFQNAWSYRWNLALFASQGYAVLAVNFHGSIGYGQKFTDSIHESWGGRPFEDLMLGVDYILSAHPYLDRSRIGALGASYGGYLINWINGHTDRFKCLVNHDGIFSLRSLYYNTEEIWFPGM
jgi:acylaminoacyl-peptidase